MFKVCVKRCDECLFGKNRIVDEPRMRQVLVTCKRQDTHFVCHKHTLRGLMSDRLDEDVDVCCRGFYDRNPMASNLMRIAARLHVVQFVNEDGSVVREGE